MWEIDCNDATIPRRMGIHFATNFIVATAKPWKVAQGNFFLLRQYFIIQNCQNSQYWIEEDGRLNGGGWLLNNVLIKERSKRLAKYCTEVEFNRCEQSKKRQSLTFYCRMLPIITSMIVWLIESYHQKKIYDSIDNLDPTIGTGPTTESCTRYLSNPMKFKSTVHSLSSMFSR